MGNVMHCVSQKASRKGYHGGGPEKFDGVSLRRKVVGRGLGRAVEERGTDHAGNRSVHPMRNENFIGSMTVYSDYSKERHKLCFS